MTSHNALRTFIRQESSITKNVLDSQQIYNPENIELLLDDKISYAKKGLSQCKKTNITHKT